MALPDTVIQIEPRLSEKWPEPQALTLKLDHEPYPVDALPAVIRAAVQEVQSFVQAPFALVAASALGALSLAAQAHFDVKRAEKLEGPISLFLISIADSGERKSTGDGHFTSAIRDYEALQREVAKEPLRKYAAAMDAWSSEREGILSAVKDAAKKGKSTDELRRKLEALDGRKPDEPKVPRLLLGDETPEALAFSLAKTWPSSGVISSEAGAVLGAHGMGKDSVMRNLALLNVLWDGGTLSIGRKTSESFVVQDARLTVALQIQEATLREFFSKSGTLARGTGFLARFLVSWPTSTQGYRLFKEPPTGWPSVTAFNRRITAILENPIPMNDHGALCPPVMLLSSDAKRAWIAFHDAIEVELRNGGELYDVRDVASKIADNAVRLAALFQIFEHGMGGSVSAECFESASRIAAWHLSESRRFFGELALPQELAIAAKLDTWAIEYCRRERVQSVSTRTIQQFGPSCLRDKLALEKAARELEELDRVRIVQDGKKKSIAVNPALLTGGQS